MVEELENIFITRLELCHNIFGNKTFRIFDKKGNIHLSQPLYDAQMIAADRLFNEKDALIKKRKFICEALNDLLSDASDEEGADKATYELIVARPNTSKSIRRRLDLIENIYRRCL